MDWKTYKGSQEWNRLKDQAMARAGTRCEGDIGRDFRHPLRCTNTRNLELHHHTYPSRVDVDCLDNVMILCRDCHEEATYQQREAEISWDDKPD